MSRSDERTPEEFLDETIITKTELGITRAIGGAGNGGANGFIILWGDDIGAVSLGSFGAKNPGTSPPIDRLAREGVAF